MRISDTSNLQMMANMVDSSSIGKTVGIKMLSNSLDSQESIAGTMTRMMEQSVTPNVGKNFDMSV